MVRLSDHRIATNSSRSSGKHDVGLVVADTAGKWAEACRYHQRLRLRARARQHQDLAGYISRALDEWTARIREWDAAGADTSISTTT